jgi:hypothetical protein
VLPVRTAQTTDAIRPSLAFVLTNDGFIATDHHECVCAITMMWLRHTDAESLARTMIQASDRDR